MEDKFCKFTLAFVTITIIITIVGSIYTVHERTLLYRNQCFAAVLNETTHLDYAPEGMKQRIIKGGMDSCRKSFQ